MQEPGRASTVPTDVMIVTGIKRQEEMLHGVGSGPLLHHESDRMMRKPQMKRLQRTGEQKSRERERERNNPGFRSPLLHSTHAAAILTLKTTVPPGENLVPLCAVLLLYLYSIVPGGTA